MFEAYLDESGIHDSAAICVIAGYFGDRAQLRMLEHHWKAVLKRFKFPMCDFHAKDLVKTAKHQPMLKALAVTIGKQRKVHPVIYGIVVDDFNSFSLKQRRWFTGATLNETHGKLVTSGCPSKPYFVPFQNCLHRVTDYAPVGQKAHFFFGLDRPFAEYATSLFAQIKKVSYPLSQWNTKDRLGDPSFPLASDTAQLQAADLLVHLSYQHMLERYEAGNWDVVPSGLLSNCLRNTRSRLDHAFQVKHQLQEILNMTYPRAGNWDDH